MQATANLQPAPVAEGQAVCRLAERIVAGDRAAEAELVLRYGRALRTTIERRVRDPELARDLYQETFRVVITRLRESPLASPERVGLFLQRTAMNIAIGEFRKEHRRRQQADPGAAAAIPDQAGGPVQMASRDEARRTVRRLIDQMGVARDRELLLRYYVLESDKARLCEEYGLSPEHFDRVVFRARQRLKALLLAEGIAGAG